jgi:DNA-binding CsgD family transcriptional regulator
MVRQQVLSFDRTPDWIGILEAAYEIERDDEGWLNGLIDGALSSLDRGLGLMAFGYDSSDPSRFRLGALVHRGFSKRRLDVTMEIMADYTSRPDFVERTYRFTPCATMSEIDGDTTDWRKLAATAGIGDTLGVNGVDPSGRGCMLGVILPSETRLTTGQRQTLNRISTHMAAAYRLRHKLRSGGVAPWGIVDRRGKVCDCAERLDERTPEALSHAARDIAEARGKMRREDADGAVEAWRTLVQRRFTLVDESPGRGAAGPVAVYENPPVPSAFLSLTEREREVASFLVLGHSTKIIAYELGISDSTVRVLLSRIRMRLGAANRAELLKLLGPTGA